jgi:hypothetical protein
LCGCIVSPWVGARWTGWQFMQRGLWITLPASLNSATERAAGSLIDGEGGGGLQGRRSRRRAFRRGADAGDDGAARQGEAQNDNDGGGAHVRSPREPERSS